MLTKKQKEKLDMMVIRYKGGMLRATRAKINTVFAWADRYRIAMTSVLQRKDKR